jgi:hypothetical protein
MQHQSVLKASRSKLLVHPLLARLNTAPAWQTFMAHHVFAVWDFMSLLKRLQQELTCTQLPWLPPSQPAHARFINEIVLAEESDDDGQKSHCSHFSYYCRAMRAAGVDTCAIDAFIAALRCKTPLSEALRLHAPSPAVAAFVHNTLDVAHNAPAHVVAAVFFYGREDVIPAMFTSLTAHVLSHDASFAPLHDYLRRHIELDGDSHGPLAAQMLAHLCAGDAQREQQACDAALAALDARYALWTGIEQAICR